MRGRALRVATVAWVVLCAAVAAADVDVYSPRYRTGESLAPLAEAAMSGRGSVALDSNTGALVLVGPAEAIAEARALLEQQDRRLRTVLVHAETRTAASLEAAGYDVAWSAGGGSARVGNVERGGSGVRVLLGEGRRADTGTRGSSVRVLEGEWGRIASGAEVLVPTGTWYRPGATRVAAESGLEVRPRILGDGRVRLDLRPFEARLAPEYGRGAVRGSAAETTLVVVPGRTAVVGGIGRAAEASGSSRLGGAASGRAARESLLLVTVSVEDDAPPPPGDPRRPSSGPSPVR